MPEGLSRRDFLRTAGAALLLNAIPGGSARAEQMPHRIMSSPVSPEELERDIRAAIDSLVADIPGTPEADYLRDYVKFLRQESQIYIPPSDELHRVVEAAERDLTELGRAMSSGSQGIFVFGDAVDGRHTQRLYTLRKNTENELQFLKGYRISMARKGYGNDNDSQKTPLKLHWVHNGKRGRFGEVVSGLNKHKEAFRRISINGEDHWFVKGFGNEDENDVAEVVTDQYLIVGPQTEAMRGIRIHGSNRSGQRHTDGTWETFLDGAHRSTGCIRMSNTGVRDLSLTVLNGINEAPSRDHRVFVMIHATHAAQDLSKNAFDFRKWREGASGK